MGTIAAQIGLDRETVRAAVEHETGGVARGVCRPSALDPYLPFIRNTLAQYPRLRHPHPRDGPLDLALQEASPDLRRSGRRALERRLEESRSARG